jgi:hypothetical protein
MSEAAEPTLTELSEGFYSVTTGQHYLGAVRREGDDWLAVRHSEVVARVTSRADATAALVSLPLPTDSGGFQFSRSVRERAGLGPESRPRRRLSADHAFVAAVLALALLFAASVVVVQAID